MIHTIILLPIAAGLVYGIIRDARRLWKEMEW